MIFDQVLRFDAPQVVRLHLREGPPSGVGRGSGSCRCRMECRSSCPSAGRWALSLAIAIPLCQQPKDSLTLWRKGERVPAPCTSVGFLFARLVFFAAKRNAAVQPTRVGYTTNAPLQ